MKKKFSLLVSIALLFTASVMAQQTTNKDTTSLINALSKGHFSGHLRYFFMNTDNENGLSDYNANAIGAGLKYETGVFHHFQLGLGFFSVFNIASSNLAKTDPITGTLSRYELALFDITNPSAKKDLTRLETAYLKYNFRKSSLKLGRQFVNTPFINPQDGRMNATAFEGIWLAINEFKKIKWQLGWLWSSSPRSTYKWYTTARSIGIYPTGVNSDGSKSLYSNNLKSSGVFITGIDYDLCKNLKLTGWNFFTQNIFNAAILQTDFTYLLKNKSNIIAGAQIIREDALNNGGNINQDETYFVKEGHSFGLGGRLGWENERWESTLNYTRITKAGRFLLPREWGTEPLFTYLTRERNEGCGNVNAMMGKLAYHFIKQRLITSLGIGYYRLPDVKDYALNKYGLPSYTQINIDAKYQFSKLLKGLDADFLFVTKFEEGDTYNNKKYIFNKVNMQQYNLVLNYHF